MFIGEAFLRTGVTEASFWDAGKTPRLIDALKNAEMNDNNNNNNNNNNKLLMPCV